jgi:hypothetical protein
MPAAVHATCREFRRGDAEDVGQPRDLLDAESLLPASTMPFSRADGGVGGPSHQFTELGLSPPVAQPEGPDVRADSGGLLCWDLIDATAPSPHHVRACQMTLYEVKAPGRSTYRFAASIASAA